MMFERVVHAATVALLIGVVLVIVSPSRNAWAAINDALSTMPL
jgi:hypothetical protein